MAEPKQPSDSSALASFASPLRWIGNIICIFSMLFLGGLAWLVFSGSTEPDIGTSCLSLPTTSSIRALSPPMAGKEPET